MNVAYTLSEVIELVKAEIVSVDEAREILGLRKLVL